MATKINVWKLTPMGGVKKRRRKIKIMAIYKDNF